MPTLPEAHSPQASHLTRYLQISTITLWTNHGGHCLRRLIAEVLTTPGSPAQTTRPSPFPNSSCLETCLYAIHGYICICTEGTLAKSWVIPAGLPLAPGCMALFLCLNTTRGQQREVSQLFTASGFSGVSVPAAGTPAWLEPDRTIQTA